MSPSRGPRVLVPAQVRQIVGRNLLGGLWPVKGGVRDFSSDLIGKGRQQVGMAMWEDDRRQ